MRKFEILEHKADLKIRAFGQTKEELFLNTLLGMQESMKPEIKGEEKVVRQIEIESLDLSALLVDFLSEVLYQNQVNKEIYNDVQFSKFTDTEIKGKIIGQKVERFGEDIKAVTHHNVDIRQNSNKIWEVTILFDV